METPNSLPLKQVEVPAYTIHISGKCNFRDEGDMRVIFANGIPLSHYGRADKAAEHYAMIHLVESGLANRQEVAAAFGCSRLTIFRAKRKYDEGGIAALVPKKRGPKEGSKVSKAKGRRIIALKDKGLTNTAIGSRLGLKEATVRKALKRMGWSQPKAAEQMPLPLEAGLTEVDAAEGRPGEQILVVQEDASEAGPISDSQAAEKTENTLEPEQVSYDPEPSDRSVDRALARLGLLQDAVPFFKSGVNLPYVGVLLAIPTLMESGIFTVAKKVYGDLGASFYGLRTIFLTLLLMALLRIKRSESLKKYGPAELGRLLGLDRGCEVKTLRRKLTCLAAREKAIHFGQQLAKIRLKRRQGTIGFLYVDGHVRVYHGKRKVSKAYVTKRRLAMPATTDYWVNDQQGEPIFVVTAPANEGLVKMLEPILAEARALIGDACPARDRRVTIVFDRGGWSPKLFVKLIAQGFDIVTYVKGKTEPVPQEHFCLLTAQLDGKKVEYWLHERSVAYLKSKPARPGLWLRRISRLNPSGHQTHIVTTRQDLSAVTLAYRMFERWRQENFFKYMAAEYAIDALVDYGVEQDDLQRLVPNPKRKEINRQRDKIKAQIQGLQGLYGIEALHNEEAKRRTMRGFKIANSALGRKIEELKQRQLQLKALYEETPARVPLKDTLDKDEAVYRLKREKKHLIDVIKMVACQAETDLLAPIRPYYARADDEGRTLIKSALMNSGDLEVTDHELRVTLNPLSSPHRTEAIRKLCEALNTTNTTYPGSKLRLVYEVKEHGHVS
jgi:transposase